MENFREKEKEKEMSKLGNVAIVMPVYNASKFLEKTVQCFLDQTYSRWELFAVDDGSTDDSLAILRKFTDPRIRIISNKDNVKIKTDGNGVVTAIEKETSGPASTRNRALDVIKNNPQFEYVAYCDSDDRWKRNHLEIALNGFVDYNVKSSAPSRYDMVYTDCDFVRENGEVVTTFGVPYYDVFNRENLEKQNFIYISTVVHKVECLSAGNFDQWCVPMEDYDMWLRISKRFCVVHIPTVTATYMYKDGGSYYTAEESQKSYLKVHLKNLIFGSDINSLNAQLENIKEMKNTVVRSQNYEEAARIRDTEKQILAKIDLINGPQAIEGWLSIEEGTSLANYAKGKDCLEIGSYKGKSANYIAAEAKSLVCIDPFRADFTGQNQYVDYTTLQEFLKNTSKFKNITPVIGKSEDVHNQFKDEQFDMMFIDGMHDYESVMNDILNYFPKLKVGGVICFHDYQKDWPGVIEAVEEYFGKPDAIHDTIAACIKTEKINFVEKYKHLKLTKNSDDSNDYSKGKLMLMKNLMMTSDMVDKLPLHEFKGYVEAVKKMMMLDPKRKDWEFIDSKKDEIKKEYKVILLAPWSHKLPNGKPNPKNFPLSTIVELVGMLKGHGYYVIQIGVAGEELIGADEIVFNASFDKLKELLDNSDSFISVDSFFPHFARFHKKYGIVLFSQSDPKLFGYPENINVLKDAKYLRREQFWLWTQAEYNEESFASAKEIFKSIPILIGNQ